MKGGITLPKTGCRRRSGGRFKRPASRNGRVATRCAKSKGLPLRSTQGLIRSMIRLLGPDYYMDENKKPLFFDELAPW